MTVRVRGIYATALTALFDDIVQASGAIEDRFDQSFPMEPALATIETTANRQGVGVHGTTEQVGEVVSRLRDVGTDTLAWRATLPRDGVFAGEVVETLGSGAIVQCVPDGLDGPNDESPLPDGTSLSEVPADDNASGFLPYSKTTRRIEQGDTLRVQVAEPSPPWEGGRPVLETTVSIRGELANLVRGSTSSAGRPELADIVPADPPVGWGIDWDRDADEADLDELAETVETLGQRAEALDDALSTVDDPGTAAPEPYYRGSSTCWVWFGRESRFALDEIRRQVTATMPGHHRIKAGTENASPAVDFVEALCPDLTVEQDFPFEVVAQQFGPVEGDSVTIEHGKPAGNVIDLGVGEVTERGTDGTLTVQREMSGSGTYDALETTREPGDVATTKFKEGRWWYPTVYKSESGEPRGTYVNICTPVELYPETVRYVDLHVDVIKQPDGTVRRVDSDELDAAVADGTIPEPLGEKARTVASAVENAF